MYYKPPVKPLREVVWNGVQPTKGFITMGDELSKEGSSALDALQLMAKRLNYRGGYDQQDRMIQDKRKSLDHAVLYSYQGAVIKKHYSAHIPLMEGVEDQSYARALINPNKLKPDYDDKVLSVGFEHDYQPGDVFEWCNTNTYWLIYLQDLTELAYFKGDIRKCSYQIEWMDEDGLKSTYAAISGPTETRIEFLQKYGNSYDVPNYSLNIYIPKNSDTIKYFRRYAKFYLNDGLQNVCWRIEAVDAFSMPGIIQFTAVEYYANDATDNVEEGIANMNKIVENQIKERQAKTLNYIDGETFVKPKATNIYIFRGASTGDQGVWSVAENYPVVLKTYLNDKKQPVAEVKWDNMYSGQFDLVYTKQDGVIYTKTIVVESLF